MRLLTQDDLIKILPINKTAIDRLVSLGKIPYKSINTDNGDLIRFNPEIISSWIKNGNNLMDDKKYLERLKNRLHSSNPEFIEELKKFSAKFIDPREPKRYYLEPVKNKKLGFVYYVKYLHNGVLIRSKWTTGTNDKELAIKFAIENRDRLLKEYLERDTKKPYKELLSIFKNYYSKDSPYLKIDIKRGRQLSENSRTTYHNFINKQFIPYLKSHGIKSIEEIDVLFMTKFQNYLLMDKKINGVSVKGIKPQTINHYISYIKLIFNHLLQEGYIKINPCKSVIGIKIKKEDVKITGCYDIEKMKGIFNKKWKDDRSYLMCLLMYTTNMRNCEIFRLRLQDITLIGQYHYINVPDSKTVNGIRQIPLHDFVYKKILSYAKKYNKTDYLLKTDGKKLGSRVYKRAVVELANYMGYTQEDIEKENIRFYSGRHFWKTLMNGENIGDIEEIFMGHKVSEDVAKRYNHKDKLGKGKFIEATKKVFKALDKYIFND
jgi:site-specific recombinase XerD